MVMITFIKRRQGWARILVIMALGLAVFAIGSLIVDSPFHSERYDFRGRLKEIVALAWLLAAISLALHRSYLAWILFIPGALLLGYLALR